MSDPKPPQTPSTEELIAAISRRLISEDGAAREAGPPAVRGQDDILELTERLDDDAEPRSSIEPPGAAARPADSTSRAEPPSPRLFTAAEPDRDRGRLLSETAARATASSFARLGPLSSDRRTVRELPAGADGRTIEDIVLEALRPLLRSWLDAHLPSIVERLVREEIARLTGEAGLR
jgi:cell pole-organizing protein PopZ